MMTPCERCGRTRNAQNSHPSLCGTRSRDFGDIALVGGRWVRHGLTMRWVETLTNERDPSAGLSSNDAQVFDQPLQPTREVA